MNDAMIQLRKLQKIYTVHERETGTVAALRTLFRRKTREIRAVDGISFEVAKGEIVGLLGPNGSGKTTTLKQPTTRQLANYRRHHPRSADRNHYRASI